MPELKFVETADGSKTLWNETIGEHYHSKHGALQESKHVFIQSGLIHYLTKENKRAVSVLEVGFGTALNFLLTADYCSKHDIELEYTGIEAYPLSAELISQTGYGNFVTHEIWTSFLKVYPAALHEISRLDDRCRLEIAHVQLNNFSTLKTVDVIYFDAFAAIHQPEMWNDEALNSCCRYLRPGGVFVTYAITGNLKRSMKALGFTIEKVQGAQGKREMLRATKVY